MDPSEQEALTSSQNDAIKFRENHWPDGIMYYTLHKSLGK